MAASVPFSRQLSSVVLLDEMVISADPSERPEGILRVAAAAKGWSSSDEPVIEAVQGGATNLLFRVFLPSRPEDSALVRLYGPGSEYVVDHERDVARFRRLRSARIAPPLLATFSNGRVEGWLTGFRPLDAWELGLPRDLPAVATAVAEYHAQPMFGGASPLALKVWEFVDAAAHAHAVASSAGPSSGAEGFRVSQLAHAGLDMGAYVRNVARLKTLLPSSSNGCGQALLDAVAASGGGAGSSEAWGLLPPTLRPPPPVAPGCVPPLALPPVASPLAAARASAAAWALRTVQAHNDLQGGNVLVNDEFPPQPEPANAREPWADASAAAAAEAGSLEHAARGGLRIIDYEYTGPNPAGFEVALLFSRQCLTHDAAAGTMRFDCARWYPPPAATDEWWRVYIARTRVLSVAAVGVGGDASAPSTEEVRSPSNAELYDAFYAELRTWTDTFVLASFCFSTAWMTMRAIKTGDVPTLPFSRVAANCADLFARGIDAAHVGRLAEFLATE